eukprot:TRINITY_DN30444_c0_g1_i1.p1 TRINITY_DN30444_c0_g1~~TRINITY_DN30444_c0_g1_i1.p1  ORF type:complete len:1311 (+),score=432.03 TRINITY_DN30444_c0_g1_i1:58-3990(+)
MAARPAVGLMQTSRTQPRVLVWDDDCMWALIEDQCGTQVSQTPVELPPQGKKIVIKKVPFHFETTSPSSHVAIEHMPHQRPYVHIRTLNADKVSDLKAVKESLERWTMKLHDEEHLILLIHPTLVQQAPQEARDVAASRGRGVADLFHKKTPSEQAERRTKDLEERLRKEKGLRDQRGESVVMRYSAWCELMKEVRERVFAAFQRRVGQCYAEGVRARERRGPAPSYPVILASGDEHAQLLRQFKLDDEARFVYDELERDLAGQTAESRRRSFRQMPFSVSPSHAPSLLYFTDERQEAFRRSLRDGLPTELETRLFLLYLQMDTWLSQGTKGLAPFSRFLQQVWLPKLKQVCAARGVPEGMALLLRLSCLLSAAHEVDSWEVERQRPRRTAAMYEDDRSRSAGTVSPQQVSVSEICSVSPSQADALLPTHSDADETGSIYTVNLSPSPRHSLERPRAASPTTRPGSRTSAPSSALASPGPGSPRAVGPARLSADLLNLARESALALGALHELQLPTTLDMDAEVHPRRPADDVAFPWPLEDAKAPLRLAFLQSPEHFGEYLATLTLHIMRRLGTLGYPHAAHCLAVDITPTLVSRGRQLEALGLLRDASAFFEQLRWERLALECKHRLLDCVRRVRTAAAEGGPGLLDGADETPERLRRQWIITGIGVVAHPASSPESRAAVWEEVTGLLREPPSSALSLPLDPLITVVSLSQQPASDVGAVVLKIVIRSRVPVPWSLGRLLVTLVREEQAGGRAEMQAEATGVDIPADGVATAVLSGHPRQEGAYTLSAVHAEAPGVSFVAAREELNTARGGQALLGSVVSGAKGSRPLLAGGSLTVPQVPPVVQLVPQPLTEHPFGAGCGGPLAVGVRVSAPLLPLQTADCPQAGGDARSPVPLGRRWSLSNPQQLPALPDAPDGAVAWILVDLMAAAPAVRKPSSQKPEDLERWFPSDSRVLGGTAGFEPVCDSDGGTTLIASAAGDSHASLAPGTCGWARLLPVQVPAPEAGGAGCGRWLSAVIADSPAPQRCELQLQVPLLPTMCGGDLVIRFVHLHPHATARGLRVAAINVRVPFAQPFRVLSHVVAEDSTCVVEVAAESLLPFPCEVLGFELALPEALPYRICRAPPRGGAGSAPLPTGRLTSRVFLLSAVGDTDEQQRCAAQARITYCRAGVDGRDTNTYVTAPVTWLPQRRCSLHAEIVLVPAPARGEPAVVTVGEPARLNITVRNLGDEPADVFCIQLFRPLHWMLLGPLKKRLCVQPGDRCSFSVHFLPLNSGHLLTPTVGLRECRPPGAEVPVSLRLFSHRVHAVSPP